MPLTKKDIEDYIQAMKDDVLNQQDAALHRWISRMSNDKKTQEANKFANTYLLCRAGLAQDYGQAT